MERGRGGGIVILKRALSFFDKHGDSWFFEIENLNENLWKLKNEHKMNDEWMNDEWWMDEWMNEEINEMRQMETRMGKFLSRRQTRYVIIYLFLFSFHFLFHTDGRTTTTDGRTTDDERRTDDGTDRRTDRHDGTDGTLTDDGRTDGRTVFYIYIFIYF